MLLAGTTANGGEGAFSHISQVPACHSVVLPEAWLDGAHVSTYDVWTPRKWGVIGRGAGGAPWRWFCVLVERYLGVGDYMIQPPTYMTSSEVQKTFSF